MRPPKPWIITMMAAIAITMVVAATASAAEPLNSTGSSAKATFGDGLETITSTESKSTGSANAAKSGTFAALFVGVKDVLGTACTGLATGESEGSISISGTFHVVAYKKGTELLTGATFLLKLVHFSCGSSLLVVVRGCVAGAITTPPNTLSKTLTTVLTAKSGDNEIIAVLNEANTAEENCELQASQNEGAFKLASAEIVGTSLGFKKGKTAEEVLVMPL
jgi:hypothetical protein